MLHVKITETGEEIDVQATDVQAMWYVLSRAGIISYPSKNVTPAEKKKGTAVWSVRVPSSGEHAMPVVVAKCPECGREGIFSDPPRVLKQYEGEKDNSPMLRCKLEHCGKTDRIPDTTFHEFYEVLRGVQR